MPDVNGLLNEGLAFQDALRLIEDIIDRLNVLSNGNEVGGLLIRLDVVKPMFVLLNVEELFSVDVNRAHTALTNIQGNTEGGGHAARRGRPAIDVNENELN